MNVEYTDAPTAKPAPGDANKIPCPYCGHLLPREATSCDHCDWTRSATEPAEGKASEAAAVLVRMMPPLGHSTKGHVLAGFVRIGRAGPALIFAFLADRASAALRAGLF